MAKIFEDIDIIQAAFNAEYSEVEKYKNSVLSESDYMLLSKVLLKIGKSLPFDQFIEFMVSMMVRTRLAKDHNIAANEEVKSGKYKRVARLVLRELKEEMKIMKGAIETLDDSAVIPFKDLVFEKKTKKEREEFFNSIKEFNKEAPAPVEGEENE